MQSMKKGLPIGVDGFEKLRENNFYYVDKTMFIADFLRDKGEVNLFTRPRRFGKTLTMTMLKTFFETGCDRSLFDGLKISREKELCDKHMGQYPVIFLTLKSVEGRNFQEAYEALKQLVIREAFRFSFLPESSRLLPNEKELYGLLTEIKDRVFSVSKEILTDSLRLLSELLAKHYGRKVVILIDEYDVPLDKAFQAGYYDEMVSLIRGLLGRALKTNDFLEFAVLTGCLRISKESIFTGLNNLKVHTVTDARYDEYFGFTEEEVGEMLDFYGLADHAEAFRDWYDGYQFGNARVYCPWDVLNYCDLLRADSGARPEDYWVNTSGNALVRRFVDRADKSTRDEIERLINGETIERTVNQELTYGELDKTIENIWSVLFSTGYLTQRGRMEGKKFRLAIPNREVRELFIEQIWEWFKDTARTDTTKLEQFCEAFVREEPEVIEELLDGYLWDSISVRDSAARVERKENFYHGMLFGLLQYESRWLVRSNAESGKGYGDILIWTPQRTGVVVELKYALDGDLEKSCAEALAQIESRGYDAEFKREGMKKIVKYGIAFYGKNCQVATDRERKE